MANTDNSCSKLEIKDTWSERTEVNEDTLGNIMDVQAETQRNVYGYKFEEMTLRDLMTFWHMNNHAMIDEIHEATDALGGIKHGDGNAIWKKWKGAFDSYGDKKFQDLSGEDQLECKFEIIDMLHFFLNYAISVGMTSSELYNMYMAKNEENRARQQRGY
jgi:hypothetical protein